MASMDEAAIPESVTDMLYSFPNSEVTFRACTYQAVKAREERKKNFREKNRAFRKKPDPKKYFLKSRVEF
jgi:hypothetical protein